VAIAKVGIGVAVRAGAPKPKIETVDDFKAALLQARRVAYIDPASGGSSGVYLGKLFERLGIADAVRAKAVLVHGGLAAERLVSGEADLAIQQISELVAVAGATLVGPLPAPIQNETTYAAAVGRDSPRPDAARALVAALAAPAAAGAIRAQGLQPAR
jgi:molybdate transport system substrate-binding protein